jgi:16S rRNA (uracil1498-N3)-methyltransferase
VNFLLLEPGEIGADGAVVLRGRRAEHVRTVLRARPGQTLRTGVVDGPVGAAVVTAVGPDQVDVRCELPFAARDDGPADVLLLAVPRPKVLLRMLAHATALGFDRIVLFRSWRVDKSHLDSDAMQPAAQREQLVAGLEQSGRTRLPRVRFFPLFKPFVEDELPGLALPPARFTAHPAAPVGTHEVAFPGRAPYALALGPDGGFLPYEVDQLAARGFVPVSCGAHPLRTETALAVLAGQLALLRERCSLAP